MRHVVVDQTDEPTRACAFSDAEQARQFALPLIRASLMAEDLLEEHPNLEDLSLEDLGEIDSAVLILPEGKEGVWTGFSSADRWSLGGPLPDPEPDFRGNGDPVAYLTAGLPDGEPAAATTEFPSDWLASDDEY